MNNSFRWFKTSWLIVIFLGFFSVFGQPGWAEGLQDAKEVPPSAGVQDISDQDYIKKVRELIAHAHESIDISLSEIGIEEGQDDPVKLLLEDLIQSAHRGIKVRLFLNTDSDDDPRRMIFLREDVLENLKKGGVHVHFVNPEYLLTDRLVIVDRTLVLEGGPPWVKEALNHALSSATLSHSEALAIKKRTRMELLPLWNIKAAREERQEGRLAVPLYLLTEVRYFPAMVNYEDGDAFKIFLVLLKLFYEHHDTELTVPLEDLIPYIPAGRYYEKSAVVYQALRTVQRLADEYWLLEIVEQLPTQVKLKLKLPRELGPVVGVPLSFFNEHYAKELTPAAIYAYFVILYRLQVSGESPVWLGSAHNISQDFPLTQQNFLLGATELRRKNLIEVFPFRLQQGAGYVGPETVEYRYLLNRVPTLAERLEMWSQLRDQYGEESFVRAREMADLIGEPEDPKVLVQYLKLLSKYSFDDVKALSQHIAGLPLDSTPNLLAYLESLLKYETKRAYELAIP
ncbi:MAG: hypothetical protein JW893_09400 [Candidatus Omnitrophica bacterium]|nr:hypothetical protein [Candidatus Omnitrophota bacterium]